MDDAFYASVSAFIGAMRRLRAGWMFIGAVPLAAWGQARASTDADFVVSLGLLDSWRLDEIMSKAGFSKVAGPAQIPQSALIVSNYIYEKGRVPFNVDVFLTTTEWDVNALARRTMVRFGNRRYWISTAEDLLLYKLMAWRKRDVEDAASIVERGGDALDWTYILKWASKLHVKQPLDQLLRDIAGGR